MNSLFLFLEEVYMLAVYVNCIAIIIGSCIGLLFSKKISSKMTDVIQMACGLISFIMGIQMAFEYRNVVYLALSLIIGGILGTLLDIDGKVLLFGRFLEKIFYKKNNNVNNFNEDSNNDNISSKKNFAYAFLNASVLFCVGAMAIIGSFKAGIEKDYSIIFLKSILDGFIAIGFAAAMGVGTAFSAIAILIYQGGLTLLSVLIHDFVSEQMIAELTASGGALIVMIGLNLMNIKSVKTANYLPAVLLSAIFVLLDPIFKSILMLN